MHTVSITLPPTLVTEWAAMHVVGDAALLPCLLLRAVHAGGQYNSECGLHVYTCSHQIEAVETHS